MRPVSNTDGYFFLEMPFYEGLIALGYRLFGVYPWVARSVNLVLYTLGSMALFSFMKGWWNKRLALFSVLVFASVPGSIFFVGHALHPDALAVSGILISLFFGWKYKEKGKFLNLILAGLFLGISVASRPFGLICLPLLFYFLFLRKSKIKDYLIIFLLAVGFYGWWWWRTKSLGIDMSWENWVINGREKLFVLENIKKLIKKSKKAITAKEASAKESVAATLKALDKARQKGIINKNAANRKKSRLHKKLNASLKK
jgi:small subunit ribosomal protein S20